MTSKFKDKNHQLNINLIQYSKPKDNLPQKNKLTTLDKLLHSAQSTNNNKILSNLNINFNIQKISKNKSNNISNISLLNQKDKKQTNEILKNSNLFLKQEIFAKKYKTTKNSRIYFLNFLILSFSFFIKFL